MAMSLKDHSDTRSTQQHLVTLQMHTYQVQEGVTVQGQSPCRTLRQARLVQLGMEPTKQSVL
jgi:hypothetical protein